jgi:hypothetical protein
MTCSRIRLVCLIAAGAGVALLACASVAQASGILGTGIGPNIGPNLNPLPSVGELLNGVVNGFFGALLSALTPDFLKHADIHTLEWLVALPNPADTSLWPNVGRLEANMMWVAGAILPTMLIIATIRDSALSLTFRAHPGNALLRATGAVFWLVLYRFTFSNGVAFINTLTHTMLSWSIVAQGLHRTVLVMFGGSVLFGAGGTFLALLGLVALVFAICLFALKIFLLVVLAVLFVGGPLVIAFAPLPAIGYLARGWLLAVAGLCLIPVGWCIVFATAGAISLDVTNLGGGAHIGSRTVGAFAALVTFYVAFKWPVMVLGHVRSALGGLGVSSGGLSGSGSVASNGALAAKAQGARMRLQAAMLAGGRGIGLAAGQLGAPRGGLVGLAGRQARPRVAIATATGAMAGGPPRPRPRPTPTGERVARAGEKLRETPARMREAWRAAGETAAPTSGRRGNPGTQDGTGAGATPGATRRRTRGRGAKGSGTPSQKPPRAGSAGPRPRKGGSRAARGGRNDSGDAKRPPVVPPPRSAQVGAPAAPASGRHAEAGRDGAASRLVSAPARPGNGSGGRAGVSRPTQAHPPTGQSPRPTTPDSRPVQPPAQHRGEPPRRAAVPPCTPSRKGGKA